MIELTDEQAAQAIANAVTDTGWVTDAERRAVTSLRDAGYAVVRLADPEPAPEPIAVAVAPDQVPGYRPAWLTDAGPCRKCGTTIVDCMAAGGPLCCSSCQHPMKGTA